MVAIAAEDSLNSSLMRNIEALRRRREQEEATATLEERLASAITRFSGSMRFVYLHLLLYGGWVAANLGLFSGIRPWDPTFVVLAMIASVEAIFLSTFILITQNRMALAADRRAELDLQVSLLAEAEITKLVQIVSEMAARMEVPAAQQEDVEEMKQLVRPEAVLDAIEEAAVAERRVRATSPRKRRLHSAPGSAVERGDVAQDGGAGAGPRREIFRQFAVPRPCCFGDRALSGHPLFNRPPPVVTLVRFHLSPPLRDKSPSRANG